MRLAKRRLFGCLTASAVLLAGFQNCDNIKFRENGGKAEESQMSGNGDGYGGKITIYHHVDPVRPCVQTGTAGTALPNDSIFLYAQGKAQIVRESCRDIKPRELASNQFKSEINGDLTYAGQSFRPHTPTDFEVAAAVCPADLSPLANPVRDNLILSALNLNDFSVWGSLGGIDVGLTGSIGGLPAYLLSRTRDSAAENHLRLDQFTNLKPNTRYAYSFLAKRGSATAVRLMMYDAPPIVAGGAVWSLTNGALISNDEQSLTQVSHASRAIGDAFFYTVYFRTPNTVRGLDIGVAADDDNLGASIISTANQLEELATFCGP